MEMVLLLPEIGKVIALCDESLFLTDSQLSQPVRKLGFVKGVTFIAKRVKSGESSSLAVISTSEIGNNSDSSSSILRKLGVGVRVSSGVKPKVRDIGEGVINGVDIDGNKNNLLVTLVGKKLVLVELVLGGNNNNNKGSLVVVKKIPCIDGVKSVVWVNDLIIVGTVNGYNLFSSVTGESRLLFTLLDAMVFPLLKLLRKERKVLLLEDNVGVVVDDEGQPVGGSLVFWRSSNFVEELSSYLMVVKDGKMELYHKKLSNCVQSFVFGGERVGSCFVVSEESGNGQIVAVVTPTKINQVEFVHSKSFLHPDIKPDIFLMGLGRLQLC